MQHRTHYTCFIVIHKKNENHVPAATQQEYLIPFSVCAVNIKFGNFSRGPNYIFIPTQFQRASNEENKISELSSL